MKTFSRRNVNFMLREVFKAEELTQYPYFQDHSQETFDMVLDAATEVAEKILQPMYVESDRKQPELVNGTVAVHPGIGKYLEAVGPTGLMAAPFKYEFGGQQLPELVDSVKGFILGSAHNSAVMFTGLTSGSVHLIMSFGSQELIDTYVEKMINCEWTGTMCLTEPQAGSALADVQTMAYPQPDGSYKIKGQKVFISAGEHDQRDNIIHLVLARIEGAPKGTKGISLMVVPKFRQGANGVFDVNNDVTPTGIYHKMGQKATPAMHLTFGEKDDCIGYLVGEPHKGLAYMFQMMNEARLGVGMCGTYIASAAYYASLQYAKERPQGRRLNNKNPEEGPTLIINHPDVKRLLLSQKAIMEGSLSLIMECARYADLHKVSTDPDEAENYHLLLDLLTPVAKTYPAEEGIRAVSDGLQVFGGYGYTEDFPLEQMYRDIRITSIYEGTTAIQSLDLLGRKVPAKGGKSMQLLGAEVMQTIQAAQTFDDLKPYAERLGAELKRMQKVTMHLLGLAMKGDTEVFLADSKLYMDFFGIVAIAWQWLKQATVAKQALVTQNNLSAEDITFYESKLHTMKFFFHYEVPKTLGLEARLLDTELLTVETEKEVTV
ncbi:MAG: acyl-CoA dehydrogenase [Spirosomataceae bacterium]